MAADAQRGRRVGRGVEQEKVGVWEERESGGGGREVQVLTCVNAAGSCSE